jgi:hypothetical protein
VIRRFLAGCVLFALAGCLPTGYSRKAFLSHSYPIERTIRPEQALTAGKKILLLDDQPGELIWLTDFSTVVLNEAGEKVPDDFLAISTLDFRWPQWHNEKFGTAQSSRLFAFGHGITKFTLPHGFGIPLHSNEPLWLTTRIVNPGAEQLKRNVRQELSIGFLRERGLPNPLRPLLVRTVAAGPYGASWAVPLGGSTQATDITQSLSITKPVRIHAATCWLETHGQEVKIRDVSSQRDVLVLRSTRDGQGRILEFDSYSSEEGLLLQPNHRYELLTRYNNPAPQEIRGVAYLNLYLDDPSFRKPMR